MKKALTILIILTVVLQLIYPCYMIWDKYGVLIYGEEIKMLVEPIDPYDAFRGRYVSLSYPGETYPENKSGRYGILSEGEDGFFYISETASEKPEGRLYLVSEWEKSFRIPFDRYYMEETLAPEAEKILNDATLKTYVTIRIKGDRAVISGLFVGDEPIEKYLTK